MMNETVRYEMEFLEIRGKRMLYYVIIDGIDPREIKFHSKRLKSVPNGIVTGKERNGTGTN